MTRTLQLTYTAYNDEDANTLEMLTLLCLLH